MNPFQPSPGRRPDGRPRKRRPSGGGREGAWMLGVMVAALVVLAAASALEIVRT